jgi:hypothetical protein
MSLDDTASNPSPEDAIVPVQPVTEEEPEILDDEAPDDTGDDEEGHDDEEVVEEVEFDFGGSKLKIAKNASVDEVAEKLQTYAKSIEGDYIRKTQSLAEVKAHVEAQSKALSNLSQVRGEALSEYSRGLQVKAELQQLHAVDLPSLWQSNPDQARMVSDMMAKKSAEFNQIVSKVQHYEANFEQNQAQAMAQAVEHGRKVVASKIPNFSPAVEAELIEYTVKNYGISEKDAKNWPVNPVASVMAWKAMQFDRMQAKAAKAAKPSTAQPVPVTAIKQRPAAPTSAAPSDKDSAEVWRRKREAQLRAQRGR